MRGNDEQTSGLFSYKGFDVAGFVESLWARRITPHVAIDAHLTKTGKRRKTAIDQRTTRLADVYRASLDRRGMGKNANAGI